MKKRTVFITLCFLCIMMVSGCTDSEYSSQEKSALESKGKKLVQEYLDEKLPGAECLSAYAVTAENDSNHVELMDYVSGKYSHENLTYDYYFNVNSKRMFTSKNFSFCRTRLSTNVFSDLGIEQDQLKAFASDSDYYLYLPGIPENFKPLPVEAIPMEYADDVKPYVDDPNREDVFEVSMEICVDAEKELDFSEFSLDRFYNGAAKQGIYFKNLTVHHALSVTYDRIGYGAKPTIIDRETYTKRGDHIGCGNDTATYELWGDVKEGDTEAHKVIYRKTEYLEPGSDEIHVKEEADDESILKTIGQAAGGNVVGVENEVDQIGQGTKSEADQNGQNSEGTDTGDKQENNMDETSEDSAQAEQASDPTDAAKLYREVVLPLAYKIGKMDYEELLSFAEKSGFTFSATEPEEYESDGEIQFESSENGDKLLLKCWPDKNGNAVLESIWYIRAGYTGFISDYCHEKEIAIKLTDDTLYEDYEMESPMDLMAALFPGVADPIGNYAEAAGGEEAFSFADLAGWWFDFSSGAGGWGTELTVRSDGTFEGEFRDSDMGDIGRGYSGGTVYLCDFTGKFSELVKVDDTCYETTVESLVYDTNEREEISDGIRWIYTGPYGLERAEKILIYLPGRALDKLPEGYYDWTRFSIEYRKTDETLPFYGLYNVNEEMGFSSAK